MRYTEEQIWELIAAFLCEEELSEEEKKQMEAWKEAASENLRKYKYSESLFRRRKELRLWEQLRTKPMAPEKKFHSSGNRRLLGKECLKYAAILFPFVCLLLWWLCQTAQDAGRMPTSVFVMNDIAPGKQKARLLLEDGKTVVLSDSTMVIRSQEDIQVEKGGVLQYATQNSKQQREAVYHALVVDRGAEFQLVLPDGTKVWLNSASELRYPDVFNETTRQVFLRGEAYFDVKHKEKQAFVVSAGNCDVRVLGTEFNISCYQEESQVVTTLVTGKIAYRAGNETGELQPGWQCVYDADNQTTDVKRVNVAAYISWKNGVFIFDNIRMEELAKQIERWYDIQVVFADEGVRNSNFTGAMERYKPVSYLLSLLNETNTVECELEGQTLIIRKK